MNRIILLALTIISILVVGSVVLVITSPEFTIKKNSQLVKTQGTQNGDDSLPLEFSIFMNTTGDKVDQLTGKNEEIKIITTVTRTDSDGNQVVKEYSSDPILLPFSILVPKNELVDLSNGSISYKFVLQGEKTRDYDVSGSLLMVLNGVQYDQRKIERTGTSDSDGKLTLRVDTINGFGYVDLKSLKYKEGINTIEVKIKDLKITTNKKDFILSDVVTYKIELEYDSVQLLQKDELGNVVRVYPEDVQLQVSHFITSTSSRSVCNSSSGGSCYQSTVYYCAGSPAPSIGKITLKEVSTGKLIKETPRYDWYPATTTPYSASGGSCSAWGGRGEIIMDILLKRNTEYQFIIGDPQNLQFVLKTPLEKTSYSFTCVGGQQCDSSVFHS